MLSKDLRASQTAALIPALERQKRKKQVDLCEVKACLLYRASSRTGRATQENPVSKKQTSKQTKRTRGDILDKVLSPA